MSALSWEPAPAARLSQEDPLCCWDQTRTDALPPASISTTLTEDSVLGLKIKNCFVCVLEAECCPPCTQRGLRHWSRHLWASPQTQGAAGSSFRSWVCVRTGRPKSPINRAHWLSASSVHSFPFWTNFWPYYARRKNRCKFPGGY